MGALVFGIAAATAMKYIYAHPERRSTLPR
jgi:hypothetical protein